LHRRWRFIVGMVVDGRAPAAQDRFDTLNLSAGGGDTVEDLGRNVGRAEERLALQIVGQRPAVDGQKLLLLDDLVLVGHR
jgi:hypothetical protein